jgi:hypothetical protein
MKNLLMTVIAIIGFATITMAQSVPSYVPISGLVAYYPLDGNGNDLSGNNNTLIPNGFLSYTQNYSGNSNSACHFPNGNDYFLTPSSSWSLINNFPQGSVSFWVKIDSQHVSGHYFGIGNSFIVKQKNGVGEDLFFGMQDGTTKIRMQVTGVFPSAPGADIIGSTSLLPNIWYHVVGTWDGVYHTLYLNGVQDGQISNSIGMANRPLPDYFSIGSDNYGIIGTNPLPSGAYGSMDDIGIWNRALTATEITALYQGCALSVTTQPINQSVNISNNAQFTTASSEPLSTYQWQTDLGVGFQNLNSVGQYSGTANDTLTIANTTLSNNNQPFRCIISSGSCTDTSNVAVLTVNNNVGINEFTQDNLFSVYPNPAHSQINVKADTKLLGSIFTVYDNTGKVVLSGKIISENTTIELGNLSGGIYLFSVGENLKQTFKVIKE